MILSRAMPSPAPRPTSAVRGIIWDYAGTVAHMGSQVVVLMVLSRLLTPREFGIAALVTLVATFGVLLSQFGILHSLVQSRDVTERALRTAFTATLLFGILAVTICLLLADPLARFFEEPALRRMLRLVSPYFLFMALGCTSEALLQRALDFRRLALANTGAYIVGYGLTAVSLASLGWGVESLMIALLLQALLKASATFWLHPHPVRPLWDRGHARRLLGFGAGISVSKLLNSAATQGDNAVVGRVLGSTVLGIYSRAYQLILLPANFVGQSLNKVLFAAWSRADTTEEKLRGDYLSVTAAVALVAGTFAAIYIVLGPELILVLLGPQWLEAWPPLQVMAFALIARTAYKVDDSLAIAKGFVRARIYRDGLYASMAVAFTLIGGNSFGLTGAATGISIAILVNYMLAVALSLRVTGVTLTEYLCTNVPGYGTAILFGLATTGAKMFLAWAGLAGSLPTLVLSIVGGVLLTGLTVLIEPRILGGRIRGILGRILPTKSEGVSTARLRSKLLNRLRP